MERRVVLIIGKSGFGKTYLARTLLASQPRSLIFDQRGEYDGSIFTDFNVMADFCASRRAFRAVWRGGYDFADALFHLSFALGNVVNLLEEADLLECNGWYREAVYRGRDPYAISLWCLAQRPHLLSPDVRSQTTDCYAFNNSEPSAITWLEYFFPDARDVLPVLPPKHGIHFSLTEHGPERTAFRLP